MDSVLYVIPKHAIRSLRHFSLLWPLGECGRECFAELSKVGSSSSFCRPFHGSHFLLRRCGTIVDETKLDDIESAFNDLRQSVDVDYTKTIDIDVHFHVIYGNTTVQGGYVPYYAYYIFLVLELIQPPVTDKSRIKLMCLTLTMGSPV